MASQQFGAENRGAGWRWFDRFMLVCGGVGLGGFFFCLFLEGQLAPPTRPTFPEPELGYTHMISLSHRYGYVYVTAFEYLARTYGPFVALGVSVVIGICGRAVELICGRAVPSGKRAPTIPENILMVCAAVAFFAFMYLIWLEGLLR
ncbi:hypothetical protein SSBR45G_03190 [Bradyrhizobium sp. SSBR45G]|uniref:hypothetical protein n=1 Tax=unclassified Bradyrhizobium TaxID=2631580 RepID=UPI0023429F69|nr:MULTISPECIES: hypothetical protein [unclassified Bradyrhizobium]GLH75411.1 hypothetical protein SSBR45G_03190 [Bradyrhizobium sp. SSBR45G]GLH82802.1 hypothetical protein SSBR45R_02620 [Bradyrhizobium sp. SSBR45R]